MKKIDPDVLTSLVEGILTDCIKSSRLAEKVLEAINDMDDGVIAYANYSFTCPGCGEHTTIEEILPGTTLTSTVTDISVDEDGDLMVDYGPTSTDGGDTDSLWYQCTMCGQILSKEFLKTLAKG